MLVLGFVLSVLWGVSYLGGGISSALSTIFSPVAGVMAVVTTSVTLTLYLLSKDTTARWFAFVSYGLMVMTAGYIIATTGHAQSPFIVLWMVLGLFCGLFGLIGFGPVAIIDAAYIAYLFSSNHADASQTITFVIVFVVPLVISVLIWRHKAIRQQRSTTHRAGRSYPTGAPRKQISHAQRPQSGNQYWQKNDHLAADLTSGPGRFGSNHSLS